MNFTQEEKEKIADIIVQIDGYIDQQRRYLRRTIRIPVPDNDYNIELVVRPTTNEGFQSEQNALVVGASIHYFKKQGKDDWLHCLQYNPRHAMRVIEHWQSIKKTISDEIAKQSKEINAINNFRL